MPCLLQLELRKVINLLLGTVDRKCLSIAMGWRWHWHIALSGSCSSAPSSAVSAPASKPATPQPPSFCLHFEIHRGLENKLLEVAKDHVIL